MKKALSLFLVVLMVGGVFFTGCTGSGDNGLDMVSSYMADDSTVVVKFRNETGKTISDVGGSLNLFGGSSSNQTPLKSPSFTWTGTCEDGMTFEVTVDVHGAPAGLSDAVNRIGFYISSIS